MSASLPLSCGRRSVRAFGASGPLDRLAEVTPEPSLCVAARTVQGRIRDTVLFCQ